ncbi:MAG: hypothetical protein AAFR63_11390 [Cyanobacteria bacterium J06631_6]
MVAEMAHDGQKAIATVKSLQPDLVLMHIIAVTEIAASKGVVAQIRLQRVKTTG